MRDSALRAVLLFVQPDLRRAGESKRAWFTLETVFLHRDLGDVLDINGDGVAEVILQRGYGEVGDIEVYEVSGGQLRLVAAIRGWTGS
jgi:hypothetical protein